MADKKSLSLYDTIVQVLAQVQEPMPIDEFATRVLAIYPSKAKNSLSSMRSTLRMEHAGKTLVLLDRQTLVPIRVAMRGVRFRIPLTRQEVSRGVLALEPALQCFHRQGLAPQDMRLLDASGRPLTSRIVTLKQQMTGGPLGLFTHEVPAFELGDWFRTHRVQRHDSVLVTIEDWEHGRFRLEHEPANRRRPQDIERQNQELANLLFDMLEAARDERLYAYRAIPTAYARLADGHGYPGDHWTEVLARDTRMQWDSFAIRYSEFRSPFEAILSSGHQGRRRPEIPYAQEQAHQVYRFTAALRYRPQLWRRLEIQGGQTLADFDAILREAFQHDTDDHLGGFWRLVRRGTGRRLREVDLGSIDPLGEGDGAEQHVAGIGLTPGDELKYVYDFGDWIEHCLTLEEIVAPETGATYPRIVAQNKPRYRYCQVCKGKQRRTVATWVCLQCSNTQQQGMVVCAACLAEAHEDHYAEEIVY